MNRRSFLQSILAAGVAPYVDVVVGATPVAETGWIKIIGTGPNGEAQSEILPYSADQWTTRKEYKEIWEISCIAMPEYKAAQASLSAHCRALL